MEVQSSEMPPVMYACLVEEMGYGKESPKLYHPKR